MSDETYGCLSTALTSQRYNSKFKVPAIVSPSACLVCLKYLSSLFLTSTHRCCHLPGNEGCFFDKFPFLEGICSCSGAELNFRSLRIADGLPLRFIMSSDSAVAPSHNWNMEFSSSLVWAGWSMLLICGCSSTYYGFSSFAWFDSITIFSSKWL